MTMSSARGQRAPKAICVGALAVLAVAAAMMAPRAGVAHEPELVEVRSTKSFDDAATGIREGLEANKMAIVRQIHFHDMLSMVDIESERMLTFETFHPRFGKLVYQNDKSAFVEPPLRIHLREIDAGTLVRYRLPSSTFAPYDGLQGLGAQLDTIFADVVGRLSD